MSPVTVAAFSFAYLGVFGLGVVVGRVIKYGHGRPPERGKRDDDACR